MTRFARARGSKSSNQRLPHPPTNWSEMKQQLLETNQTMDQRKIDDNVGDEEKIKKMRLENYEKFLNEEVDSKNNAEWAEFEAENKDGDDDGAPGEINSKPALIEADDDDNDNDDDDDGAPVEINSKPALIEAENDDNDNDGAPVEINSKSALIQADDDDNDNDDDDDGAPVEINSKPALIEAENDNDDDDDDDDDDAPLEVSSKQPVVETVKPVQVKMEKKKIVEIQPEQKNKILKIVKKGTKIVERKKKRQQKQLIKKRIKDGQIDEANLKETGEEIEKPTEIVAKKQLKKPQIKVNDKNVKNKKREETEIIHGRQIVIKHLDGFRIKKEDYERIMQLKKDLKAQKQPKGVIAEAVKRVRRVAEKKLRNEYKKVCFKCRQPGHQFTECPQSQMETNSAGVCFKCGSTEHTHYQCKVVKNDNFRYATCFICGNEGHISRQCPQNTNGVYPKGGNCLVCGSNGHLKKDCPQFRQQQQEQKSNYEVVGVLDSFKNPEADDFDDKKFIKTKKVKRVNFNK